MKIFLKLEAPYEWVRLNGQHVDGFGETPSLDDYPIDDEDEVVGVVPGEWVTSHEVVLPAKTRKQFMTALPYALEDSLTEDVDNLHFVCPQWKADQSCLVQVVAKEKMREWQALANHYRLPITQLVPDHSLLPFHDAADYSLAHARNLSEGAVDSMSILAACRDGSTVTLDAELLDIWLMDLPLDSVVAVNDENLTEQLISDHPDRDFRHWPFGSKMAHWLEYPFDSKINLWGDVFVPSVSRFSKRALLMPLAFLGLAVFVKFAYDSYRYFSLHAEIKAIQGESQAILKKHFPNVGETEVRRERIVMEKAIQRLGGVSQDHGFHFMLSDVAKTLNKEKVSLSDFTFRNDELVITCLLNDFSQVDKVAKQLNAKAKLTAELQSSESDEGKVIASYRLTQSL